jgi:DnaK suppressor protein
MNRTDIDVQHFQDKLLAEQQRLESELNSLGRTLNDKGDWVAVPAPVDKETPEFDETADTVEEFESNIAVLNVLEQQHNEVMEALERIKAGTYGVDESTGEPIPVERLEAYPAATTALATDA